MWPGKFDKAKQGWDAELDYNRTKALYDSQAVSKAQFEQAESMLNNARIGVELAGNSSSRRKLPAKRRGTQQLYCNIPIIRTGGLSTSKTANCRPQATALTVVELATVKVKVNLSENAVVSIKRVLKFL